MKDSYILRSGNTEAIISSIGGTVLSFKVNGEDILFPFHMTKDSKKRGGCPPCAPWFGPAPEFGEQKHGFLRELPASAAREDGDETRLNLAFFDFGRGNYRWPLWYTVHYALKDGQLTMWLVVQRSGNDGEEGSAPVNLAFHPYFKGDGNEMPVVIGSSLVSGFSEKSASIPFNGQNVSIETPKNKIMVHLGGGFLEPGSALVLWSDDSKRYFCIEPVLQERRAFNTAKGRSLAAGQTESVIMTISVI